AVEHAYRLEVGGGPRSAAAFRSRVGSSAGRPVRPIVVGGAGAGGEAAGGVKKAWGKGEGGLGRRSRCGDFKGPRVEKRVRAGLTRLGVRLIDRRVVTEVRPDEIKTKDGLPIACDICVWSGGLRSTDVAQRAGLATDMRGRVLVDANLRS